MSIELFLNKKQGTRSAQQSADRSTRPDVPLTHDRLTKALDLVLSHAVVLYHDNTASVNSGSHRDSVANGSGSGSCADATHRGHPCKHQLAVDMHHRAMALLHDTPAVAANNAAPTTAGAAEPSTPGSAQWDGREAPTSCYLEFRVPSLKLGYTMRGTTDPEVLTRLTQYLPTLQDIIETYEERYAAEGDEGQFFPLHSLTSCRYDKPCIPQSDLRGSDTSSCCLIRTFAVQHDATVTPSIPRRLVSPDGTRQRPAGYLARPDGSTGLSRPTWTRNRSARLEVLCLVLHG